jgi:hypothetical protein
MSVATPFPIYNPTSSHINQSTNLPGKVGKGTCKRPTVYRNSIKPLRFVYPSRNQGRKLGMLLGEDLKVEYQPQRGNRKGYDRAAGNAHANRETLAAPNQDDAERRTDAHLGQANRIIRLVNERIAGNLRRNRLSNSIYLLLLGSAERSRRFSRSFQVRRDGWAD